MKDRRSISALLVLVAIAGLIPRSLFAGQAPAQSRENALLQAAEEAERGDNSVFDEIESLEPRALGAADAHAERHGERLILHLKSGGVKVYENRPECHVEAEEAQCQKYVLLVHAASRRVFVVAVFYYESAEYLLIDDASGEETSLHGFPLFSPSGKHVLVLLGDEEEAGFAVQVWRREGHKFLLDWSGSPHVEGLYTSYALEHWSSDDRINLLAKNSFESPKPDVVTHFELRHAAGGWRVVEVP